MTKHKGGKVIRQGKRSSIREASPDDPIYTRGFLVGGNYSGRRTINDQDKNTSNNSIEKIPYRHDASLNQEEE